MKALMDEQLFSIISKVKKGETVTAFTVAYVLVSIPHWFDSKVSIRLRSLYRFFMEAK